jgi:hypothetical protein
VGAEVADDRAQRPGDKRAPSAGRCIGCMRILSLLT